MTSRYAFALLLGSQLLLTVAAIGAAEEAKSELTLQARARVESSAGEYVVKEQTLLWKPRQTAIIICDMWDDHWCRGATKRVVELAPFMNRVVAAAREKGVFVIHAPSSCMEPYKDHPGRKLAQAAPTAGNLPKDINQWCRHIPEEEKGRYPVDQANGGCDCTPRCKGGSPWRRQIEAIEIRNEDAISDSGVEIWNLLAARGIDNVVLMGVHTNMCVLGRPFGLRNMARYGKHVVLARDLTDTMYDSRRWPFVSHFEGTNRVVEHIEKFVCPTILSTSITGQPPFQFRPDDRPRAVFVIGEGEYETAKTLPAFAESELEPRGIRCTFVMADEKTPNDFPDIAALDDADLMVLSVRRRAPKADELTAIRKYLASGKPLVGIRTASHAFDTKGKCPEGHAEWLTFDADVLGGNYQNHHPNNLKVTVSLAPGVENSPLLAGVTLPFPSGGSLYRNTPLASSSTPLLQGTIPGAPTEPLAWTHLYGKSRVFYTSLGHKDDFEQPAFRRLMLNAVYWALDRKMPEPDARQAQTTATTSALTK